MRNRLRLKSWGLVLSTLSTMVFAAGSMAATPTYYSDRPTFEAALGALIVDDYAPPVYPAGFAIYDNATMSAFLGETDYFTTGFSNWNILQGTETYCAGCNGSFQLSFLTTSFTVAGEGVYGAGVDITAHNLGTPYYAFITFGDGTTASVALPGAGTFWGVTAPENVTSIHFGLDGGASTTSGSFVIDNLTIGNTGAPPPAPPAPVPAEAIPVMPPWALLALSVMLGLFGSARLGRRLNS